MIETLIAICGLVIVGFLFAAFERWHQRHEQIKADRQAREWRHRPRVMPTISDRYDHSIELGEDDR